jgi:asparagine synthase (glutamine-hydrolysing)
MCGVAGIVSVGRDGTAALDRMLPVIAHRGPDDEGRYLGESVALGHRRLSIIDLGSGHQPLHDGSGTLWLVANGEIYNYIDLRKDLEARGHQFLTGSDCEVILHLYREYAEDCLSYLRGMYAFALWDTQKRQLFVARDHLGQKPLFYVDDSRCFAFASEIKSLLALDPTLREMNLEALDQYLALRLIASPRSMFKRVHKLPPGHALTVRPGERAHVWRYWTLRYQPKLAGSEEALTDALEAEMLTALRLHLIVAMLARHCVPRGFPTFTISIPHPRFDEAPYARQVAELYGTEHHEGKLVPNLAESLPTLVWHLDEPSDPLALCTYELARFARREVKVVIGGDGGDELFGGYDRYYGFQYAGRYSQVPAAVRRRVLEPLLSLVPEGGWYKSRGHQMRWLHRMSFLNGGKRYAGSLSYFYFDEAMRHELLSPGSRAALGNFDPEGCIREPFDRLDGEDLDRMLYADAEVRMPDHPVMITDRMTMAHGLEARSPFMDHKLAEFAARLPCSLKVRGSKLRYLQRKLAARYLPQSLLQRPKQGFASALPYLLQNEYRRLYAGFLPTSQLVADGILRGAPINALLNAHLAGKADHGNRLWLLLNAEVWYRMHIKGARAEELSSDLR